MEDIMHFGGIDGDFPPGLNFEPEDELLRPFDEEELMVIDALHIINHRQMDDIDEWEILIDEIAAIIYVPPENGEVPEPPPGALW